MKREWLPLNGRALLERRRNGTVPVGPVNVSMDLREHDDIGFAGTVLTLRASDPAARMDWRMLVNLDVWVWADDGQPINRVQAVVRDIAGVCPKSLFLRFVDTNGFVHDVDCGTGTHRAGAPVHGVPAEHSFIFCPINTAGSRLGRALCRSLNNNQEHAWN